MRLSTKTILVFVALVGIGIPILLHPSQDFYEAPKTVRIILVGDLMLDRGVEYMMQKYGQNDPKFPFLKIAEYFKTADIVFGNLEGPISDKGEKAGSIYSFQAMPQMIDGLRSAGFNVLSLANNHAFDYGRLALEDTMKRLKEAGISYTGAGFSAEESGSAVILEAKGTKIAFLAYTNLCPASWSAKENSSGINCLTENYSEKLRESISQAKNQADIVIVSLHAGEEYQKDPNQFQVDFFKTAKEAGADLVIGHHPHVVQSPLTNSGQIFYSLGNFIFDQNFSAETMKGEIVEVLLVNGKIKETKAIETKINDYYQPEI